MLKINLFSRFAAIPLLALALGAGAQQTPSASTTDPAAVNLRVQLVISRMQGEQKVASLPYTFMVSTSERSESVQMRMNVSVPYSVGTSVNKDGTSYTTTNYHDVGTSIDCLARPLPDGRYALQVRVSNSSVPAGRGGDTADTAPRIRRFEATLNPVLRDGQSVQTTAATDPVTGEVTRIDITVNVVK